MTDDDKKQSSDDQQDSLLMYYVFREAITEWTRANAGRFVRPSIEHWPDGITTQAEATEYYGEQHTNEIIALVEDIVEDGVELDRYLSESDGELPAFDAAHVSATAEEIKEWDKHHDGPHPVFRVEHRPERQSVDEEPSGEEYRVVCPACDFEETYELERAAVEMKVYHTWEHGHEAEVQENAE